MPALTALWCDPGTPKGRRAKVQGELWEDDSQLDAAMELIASGSAQWPGDDVLEEPIACFEPVFPWTLEHAARCMHLCAHDQLTAL